MALIGCLGGGKEVSGIEGSPNRVGSVYRE